MLAVFPILSCLFLLAWRTNCLEISFTVKSLLEASTVEDIRKLFSTLCWDPDNYSTLAALQNYQPYNFARYIDSELSKDPKTEALKSIATSSLDQETKDMLLSPAVIFSNSEFLRWAIEERNYIPKRSLASENVLIGSTEEFMIFGEAVHQISGQALNMTSLEPLYRYLCRQKDVQYFAKIYPMVSRLLGPAFLIKICNNFDQPCPLQQEFFSVLQQDQSFNATSRLFAYLCYKLIIQQAPSALDLQLLEILNAHPNEDWKLLFEKLKADDWDSKGIRCLIIKMSMTEELSPYFDFLPSVALLNILLPSMGIIYRRQDWDLKAVIDLLGEKIAVPPAYIYEGLYMFSDLWQPKQIKERLTSLSSDCLNVPSNSLRHVAKFAPDHKVYRAIYLRQFEIIPNRLALISASPLPLSLDNQRQLLLPFDSHDYCLEKGWSFSSPQELEGGQYVQSRFDLALNYLRLAPSTRGYLWDDDGKVGCDKVTLKRWSAFILHLPVLLLKREKIHGISFLFDEKLGNLFHLDLLRGRMHPNCDQPQQDAFIKALYGAYFKSQAGFHNKLRDFIDADYDPANQ